MGVFLRIDVGRCSARSEPHFLGILLVDEIRPTANYELWDLMPPDQETNCLARLVEYPRWTEPGLALAARLIERSDPAFLSEPLAALPLAMTFSVGPSAKRSKDVELLSTREDQQGFSIVMASEMRRQVIRLPAPDHGASIRDLLLDYSRQMFGWHLRAGRFPMPLSRVPIRDGANGAFVALADIPSHPRAYFVQLYGIGERATTAPAALWFHFVGEDPEELISERLREES